MNMFENKDKRPICGHILVPFTEIFSKQGFSTNKTMVIVVYLYKNQKNLKKLILRQSQMGYFEGNFDPITVEHFPQK